MTQPIVRDAGIIDVAFGDNVTVIRPVNLYGCVIGDNSFIGPFVEIQRGVRIGRNCRIQSHAFICECVTVGDDCFVSHGAMFINDTFADGDRAHGRQELYRETTLGNHVLIGTNATILPVRIADHTVIGAGAVVTRDIEEGGTVYAGNPARMVRKL